MVYMRQEHHQYNLLDRNKLVHDLQLDTKHHGHTLSHMDLYTFAQHTIDPMDNLDL